MSTKQIERLIQATPVTEGAGVTVHRTIGTSALRHLDPFLLLDHFGTDDPDQYIAGFPDHPHRGFTTLTYMIDGHMLHEDSMGNKGDLKAGGIQWMKAASGVIHSEMPQQSEGLMRGFQLWINLPAEEKMSAPDYQPFPATAIPVTTADNARIRVISGSYGDVTGPVSDPSTGVRYLDVTLSPGASFADEVPTGTTMFLYAFEGSGTIGGEEVPTHALAVMSPGGKFVISAENELRFILVAGRPIAESIVQYGPFVMNSRQEIEQAFVDYNNGTLARTRAAWVND